MQQQKKEGSLDIMKYKDWVAAQRFKDSREHYQYVPKQEQEFLRHVIYPMFYKESTASGSFPLVLKDYSTIYPKYVIDNDYFTVIFFKYGNCDDERCWEVSVHIKNHSFCDKRIKEFKVWFAKRYDILFTNMVGMPEKFKYPHLNLHGDEVQDFSIEFWNYYERDFMLFRLLDVLRLF